MFFLLDPDHFNASIKMVFSRDSIESSSINVNASIACKVKRKLERNIPSKLPHLRIAKHHLSRITNVVSGNAYFSLTIRAITHATNILTIHV